MNPKKIVKKVMQLHQKKYLLICDYAGKPDFLYLPACGHDLSIRYWEGTKRIRRLTVSSHGRTDIRQQKLSILISTQEQTTYY